MELMATPRRSRRHMARRVPRFRDGAISLRRCLRRPDEGRRPEQVRTGGRAEGCVSALPGARVLSSSFQSPASNLQNLIANFANRAELELHLTHSKHGIGAFSNRQFYEVFNFRPATQSTGGTN